MIWLNLYQIIVLFILIIIITNVVNKKRILIVTECFYPEEFKINEIALYWKSIGYEVGVLTLAPTYPKGKIHKGYKNKLFQKESYHGINIYRVYAITGYVDSKFNKILKYLSFMVLGSILSIFIGRKYDYIFGYNLGALTDMLPAVLIKKIYQKPLMFWVQDIWPDSLYAYGFKRTIMLSGILNFFVKFIYSNANNIGISGKGFESKLKFFTKPNQKFYYLPNWADPLDDNQERVNLSQETNVHFTFAGNIGKVQNLENIIYSFCALSEAKKRKSQLNIIGDGSNLMNLKKLANNDEKIIFHGTIKRKNMSSYYKSSDFLIVSLIDKPIFKVTVPAKIQTYIAAKKPILAIINGDTADIVTQNKLGLSVNPSDIVLIREALEKCINMSEDEKVGFTKNSEKILRTVFNKNTIMNDMTNILTN
mgnify:CR=1 FL=1